MSNRVDDTPRGRNDPDAGDGPDGSGVVLVIEAGFALPMIYAHPRRYSIVMARSAIVDRALLARVCPECIVIPLLGPTFDATQMLTRLVGFGYRGHVCAVTPPLPAPKMVEAELRAVARGMDLDLVTLD